jgi:hypothetical protein
VTHTFVKLQVSGIVYDEIAEKLKAAGYEHAFVDGVLDMNGLALVKEQPDESSTPPEGYEIRRWSNARYYWVKGDVCSANGYDGWNEAVGWALDHSCGYRQRTGRTWSKWRKKEKSTDDGSRGARPSRGPAASSRDPEFPHAI